MKDKIKKLAEKQIYLGTSSWKYPGWRGQIYNRQYKSEKEFGEKCLEEYAEHFPAVGIDHTYYDWPKIPTLKKYYDQTPKDFHFGLKVTEQITVFKYPKLKRYGKHAGTTNESFLNAPLFKENFLKPLETLGKKSSPLVFEFSHFYPGTVASGSEFVERLDKFFSEVGPADGLFYAIEMRNRNWLEPPYFKMLAKHGVSHVFNSWTKMPTLLEQLELTKKWPMPAFVSRVLLQPGTKYEEAVEAFAPYDKIQEEYPELRKGAAGIIERALEVGAPAFVFVNNRAEGNAPLTIDGILNYL